MTFKSITPSTWLAALGAVALLAMTACGSAGSGSAAKPSGAAAAPAGATQAPAEITITALDTMKFDPAQIKVPAAGPVIVHLVNKGVVDHDFTIEGVQNKLKVEGGQTGTATFTLPKAGTLNFGCSVAGHKEAGMKGTITVG